jgi:hypothetical protein
LEQNVNLVYCVYWRNDDGDFVEVIADSLTEAMILKSFLKHKGYTARIVARRAALETLSHNGGEEP